MNLHLISTVVAKVVIYARVVPFGSQGGYWVGGFLSAMASKDFGQAWVQSAIRFPDEAYEAHGGYDYSL